MLVLAPQRRFAFHLSGKTVGLRAQRHEPLELGFDTPVPREVVAGGDRAEFGRERGVALLLGGDFAAHVLQALHTHLCPGQPPFERPDLLLQAPPLLVQLQFGGILYADGTR